MAQEGHALLVSFVDCAHTTSTHVKFGNASHEFSENGRKVGLLCEEMCGVY